MRFPPSVFTTYRKAPMKVRMNPDSRAMGYEDGVAFHFEPEEVYDVTPARAQSLIEAGAAKAVDPPAPAAKK